MLRGERWALRCGLEFDDRAQKVLAVILFGELQPALEGNPSAYMKDAMGTRKSRMQVGHGDIP
jgi:hypothetical protein